MRREKVFSREVHPRLRCWFAEFISPKPVFVLMELPRDFVVPVVNLSRELIEVGGGTLLRSTIGGDAEKQRRG
jgi:hypothetical protein